MTLIADSGSTKTSWALLPSGNMVVTEGLNPHFATDEQFRSAFAMASALGSVESVVFYGAGCGNHLQAQRVEQLLKNFFQIDNVLVFTDMLGACRAVCADRPGLVGILGTGSNACLYDGQAIVRTAPSLGYILGDHGSANHVGRMLLRDYLSHTLPHDVNAVFHDAYAMSDGSLMDAVYRGATPNRFLASLAVFVANHINNAYCQHLVEAALSEWYHFQVEPLLRGSHLTEISLVGGFASAIAPRLTTFLSSKGLLLRTIEASPINGLLRYHQLVG